MISRVNSSSFGIDYKEIHIHLTIIDGTFYIQKDFYGDKLKVLTTCINHYAR